MKKAFCVRMKGRRLKTFSLTIKHLQLGPPQVDLEKDGWQKPVERNFT